jgi:hypothetical protein
MKPAGYGADARAVAPGRYPVAAGGHPHPFGKIKDISPNGGAVLRPPTGNHIARQVIPALAAVMVE